MKCLNVYRKNEKSCASIKMWIKKLLFCKKYFKGNIFTSNNTNNFRKTRLREKKKVSFSSLSQVVITCRNTSISALFDTIIEDKFKTMDNLALTH